MSAPTHIRFTQDESRAIDAYAATHGLRKASAVRQLLRLGLEAAHAAASATDAANGTEGAQLQRIEAALAVIRSEHGRQLQDILRHLIGRQDERQPP